MLIGCRHRVMMLAESLVRRTKTLPQGKSCEQQSWFSKLAFSALRKHSKLKQVNSIYEACESDVCFARQYMPASFHVACDNHLLLYRNYVGR